MQYNQGMVVDDGARKISTMDFDSNLMFFTFDFLSPNIVEVFETLALVEKLKLVFRFSRLQVGCLVMVECVGFGGGGCSFGISGRSKRINDANGEDPSN